MSASGSIFPAENVFKHFVHPVPPYDSRVMNMSPKAYLQRLIDQGLIKDEHDQNARLAVHKRSILCSVLFANRIPKVNRSESKKLAS